MMRYSIAPGFRKYVKGYGFLSFAKNFGNKYGKRIMVLQLKLEWMQQKLLLKEFYKKLQKLQVI